MSSKVAAMEVLLHSKMVDLHKGIDSCNRLKAIYQSIESRYVEFPYTDENLDTIMTMFVSELLKHNLPMMLFWYTVSLEILIDTEVHLQRENRRHHQLARIKRVALQISEQQTKLVAEIQQLQKDLTSG